MPRKPEEGPRNVFIKKIWEREGFTQILQLAKHFSVVHSTARKWYHSESILINKDTAKRIAKKEKISAVDVTVGFLGMG